MQHQQIRIARNDHICPSIQCNFQKLVVLRIAAFADKLNDRHELGGARELPEKELTLFPADVSIQLSPEENVSKFAHCGFGKKEHARVQCFVNSLAWNGEGQDNCADEYIDVNDNAIGGTHRSFDISLSRCRQESPQSFRALRLGRRYDP